MFLEVGGSLPKTYWGSVFGLTATDTSESITSDTTYGSGVLRRQKEMNVTYVFGTTIPIPGSTLCLWRVARKERPRRTTENRPKTPVRWKGVNGRESDLWDQEFLSSVRSWEGRNRLKPLCTSHSRVGGCRRVIGTEKVFQRNEGKGCFCLVRDSTTASEENISDQRAS